MARHKEKKIVPFGEMCYKWRKAQSNIQSESLNNTEANSFQFKTEIR